MNIFISTPTKTIFHSTDSMYLEKHFTRLSNYYKINFILNNSTYSIFKLNTHYIASRFLGMFNFDPISGNTISVPSSIDADLVFAYGPFPKSNLKLPIVWEQTFAPTVLDIDDGDWMIKMIKERYHSVEQASAIVTSPAICVKYFRDMFPHASSKVFDIPYYLPYLEPVSDVVIEDKFKNLEKIKVIFVGKQAIRKGLDTIINAFNMLSPKERSDFDVTVVSEMRDGKLNLPLEFHYYRFVDDVITEIRKNHIMLFPTKHEAYGLVLQEAMASGCAIITTIATIQKDLVGERGGIFINPFDHYELYESFKEILKNRGRLKQMATVNLHRFNEVYHHEVVGRKYLDLFEKVLKC